MHKVKRHTLQMIGRTIRPDRGEKGMMGVAAAVAVSTPLLMAQTNGQPIDVVTAAAAAAVAGSITAAVGLTVKLVWVAIAAGLRSYRDHTERTPSTADDLPGRIAGAVGDAIDKEHARPKE